MTHIPSAFTCNQCGAHKQIANHWWIIFRFDPAKVKVRMVMNLPRMFEIREWNIEDAYRSDAIHICGEACLHKVVSELCQEISAAYKPQPMEGAA